jgi:hypothetical protein
MPISCLTCDYVVWFLQVPYYLGEMTEQVEQEDRVPVLKASQDHLKVCYYLILRTLMTHSLGAFVCVL